MTARERRTGRQANLTGRPDSYAPKQETATLAPQIGPAAAVRNTPVGRHMLSRSQVIQLQRTLGNQAVGRILAGRAQRQNRPGPPAEEVEPQEGSLPDFPPSPELSVEKGQAGRTRAFGVPVPQIPPPPPRIPAPAPTGGYKVTTGIVNLVWGNPKTLTNDEGRKLYGASAFRPGYKNVTYITGKKSVKLYFTLDIQCPWNVFGSSKPQVSPGEWNAVTATNFQQIVKDLTPKKRERCWRAPFKKYWSRAIVERHEKFHTMDDIKWSKRAGKRLVTRYLNGKRVAGNDLKTELDDLMKKAITQMWNANWDYYTGGAKSYYSRAGEQRAYSDGKQPTESLAGAVGKYGKALKKRRENQIMFGIKPTP